MKILALGRFTSTPQGVVMALFAVLGVLAVKGLRFNTGRDAAAVS